MPAAISRPTSVRIGFALFVIGLVFLVVTVLPFFFGDHNRPLWLNLGCLGVPIGFVVAVTGAVRAGRADQRAALAELDRSNPVTED
ncbi:MAG: hypothetical protein M3Y42_20185 [Actinomycetota bacterium]|nr:hypothetical protein [Actinomycetota bacterium]MDQ2959264.1 hypothetical protein [Actinomycetota bacterium]